MIYQDFKKKVQFAPIGLINMYNSGGAVDAVDFTSSNTIRIKGRGEGIFGAYSSLRPQSCTINSEDNKFEFKEEDNFLTMRIPARTSSWDIVISY